MGAQGLEVGGQEGVPRPPWWESGGWGVWGWNEEEERLEFSGSRLGVWQGMFENHR